MKQFDRQYRFAAGRGNSGFEVGKTTLGSPAALHINFNVEKADTETPNSSRISLWNLNHTQLAVLNEKDCPVMLRAGYGNIMPIIFIGTVSYIYTELDGADRETVIELIDGRVELRDTFVSLSYSGSINSKIILQAIAGEMGTPVTFSYNAKFYDFPNGFSYVGSVRTALDKACSSSGLQWQIQNGILQIKNRNDVMAKNVFVLSPETGLINIPKKVMISADGFSADTDGQSSQEKIGYEVEYLLNGAIGISDFVKLESKIATGYFRVHTIDMQGNNIEGDWLCMASLIEV